MYLYVSFIRYYGRLPILVVYWSSDLEYAGPELESLLGELVDVGGVLKLD